jgi:hypothetical protein
MFQIFRERKRILRDGIVVWGAVIQANRMIFTPGPRDVPGEVVYCPDLSRKVNVGVLSAVAGRLFSLKGTTPDDQNLNGIANYLANERIRVFGLPVPHSVSPELPCMISTIFFRRTHLPNRVLSSKMLPIILLPKAPRLAMVLPSKYWPDELVAAWR